MPKKIINIFFSTLLILVSFFYSNKIIKIFRNSDPIMQEIKKYDEIYSDTRIDSIIVDNDIIPGLKGKAIDIESSYSNMKKTGKFDKNLLVFKETNPIDSIKDNYNNYIISMNKSQNNVSLLFELYDTNYLEKIISILKNKNVNATFFITKEIFDNSSELLKKVIESGNDIELLSDNYSVYEVNKYNSILKLISKDKLKFCFNKSKNEELLKSCKTSKLYTIVPTVVQNNLYLYLKNNLENGQILDLTNNKKTIDELSISINYIKQKGKDIVLLKNIIE